MLLTTNSEFIYILTRLGNLFTDEECNEFFKEYDLDKNGILNYKEFINLV